MKKNNKLYLFDKFDKYSTDDIKNNLSKFNVNTNNIVWFEEDLIKNMNFLNETKNINLNFIYINLYDYDANVISLVGSYHLLNPNGICGINFYNNSNYDVKKAINLFFKLIDCQEYYKINEFAIYWKKKINKFISNNENLIYNFFSNYSISNNYNKLSSCSILKIIFNYFNFSVKMTNFTQELQNIIGVNNTI